MEPVSLFLWIVVGNVLVRGAMHNRADRIREERKAANGLTHMGEGDSKLFKDNLVIQLKNNDHAIYNQTF